MQISSRFTIGTHVLIMIALQGEKTKVTSDFLAGSVGVNPVIIGHNIHNVLDGKLEDIQTAMEKEMSQTTLKDVVEDTQKRMKLESVS